MPRSFSAELLDGRAYRDLNELRGNLRDMARYDRWLGVFDEVLALVDLTRTRTTLDVGIGSGEFIALAQTRAPHVVWTALDLSLDVLHIAQAHTQSPKVQARAQMLPFADASFDVVTCANTLHHLNESDAMLLLRECARVARQRVVVLDLARHPLTTTGAWLLTRLTSRNHLTRADGVQSARRAYTAAEARTLAHAAGLTGAIVRQSVPVRYSLVWTRQATE